MDYFLVRDILTSIYSCSPLRTLFRCKYTTENLPKSVRSAEN